MERPGCRSICTSAGREHAVLHLLYARFWHKVLFDRGHVSTAEPFRRLVNQGMILGEMEFTGYRDAAGNWVSARVVKEQPGPNGETVKVDSARESLAPRIQGRLRRQEGGRGFVLRPITRRSGVESRAHKMSKSRGNVVNPDDVVDQYGADALRLYEMFMGPLEATKPWSMDRRRGE